MPFRAETIRGYLQGVHQQYLTDPAINPTWAARASAAAASIETRFRYNQDFKSVYAMVPSTYGDVAGPDFRHPDGVGDRPGKGARLDRQPLRHPGHPHRISHSASSFLTLQWPWSTSSSIPDGAVRVWRAAQGKLSTLALGALVYVTATTGYGMLISSFASTQIAALFGTAILTMLPATQFSGMLTPVSSLSGAGAIIGHLFPMTYFLPISVGTFTKGLGLRTSPPA